MLAVTTTLLSTRSERTPVLKSSPETQFLPSKHHPPITATRVPTCHAASWPGHARSSQQDGFDLQHLALTSTMLPPSGPHAAKSGKPPPSRCVVVLAGAKCASNHSFKRSSSRRGGPVRRSAKGGWTPEEVWALIGCGKGAYTYTIAGRGIEEGGAGTQWAQLEGHW